MNFRAHVLVVAVGLTFIFPLYLKVLAAQDQSHSIFDPVQSLMELMEAEKSKGEWIFYRQRFLDKDNRWAQYEGSIYAAVQSMRIEKCQVDLDMLIVDHFRGIVANSGTGEQQDSTRYVISFALTPAIADTLQVIEARPAQLRRSTHAICDEKPSCALTWIQMKSEERKINERITTNDHVEFAGLAKTGTMPASSWDAGATMVRDFRAVASGCR